MERDVFYCPAAKEVNIDDYWVYSVNPLTTVTGYHLLCNIDSFVDPPYVPEKLSNSDLDWELATDNLRETNGAWDFVNHMDSSEPAGGNILHVGGSVEWRPWDEYDDTIFLIPAGGNPSIYYSW